MEWKHSSPVTKNFKIIPSAHKVILSIFWDSKGGVILAEFQAYCETVNTTSYCATLKKLRQFIYRKCPGLDSPGRQCLPSHGQNNEEPVENLKLGMLEGSILYHRLSSQWFPSFLGPLKNHLGGRHFWDNKRGNSSSSSSWKLFLMSVSKVLWIMG